MSCSRIFRYRRRKLCRIKLRILLPNSVGMYPVPSHVQHVKYCSHSECPPLPLHSVHFVSRSTPRSNSFASSLRFSLGVIATPRFPGYRRTSAYELLGHRSILMLGRMTGMGDQHFVAHDQKSRGKPKFFREFFRLRKGDGRWSVDLKFGRRILVQREVELWGGSVSWLRMGTWFGFALGGW
jgi:hypothetical protein